MKDSLLRKKVICIKEYKKKSNKRLLFQRVRNIKYFKNSYFC